MKIGIEKVSEDLQNHGWRLLSGEYKNLDSELSIQCPYNHLSVQSYKTWRKNKKCPRCEEENIKTSSPIIKNKKGKYRILALDDSTTITGWAIFDDGELLENGVFRTTKQDSIDKILQTRQWLISIIDNWKPDIVAIEDIQLQKNPQTFKTLAQLQGVLLITLKERNITSTVIHVSTWRSYAGIKARTRSDQKRKAQQLVHEKYGKKVSQDEADAICIGRFLSDSYIKSEIMLNFDEVI